MTSPLGRWDTTVAPEAGASPANACTVTFGPEGPSLRQPANTASATTTRGNTVMRRL
jgi:hypothetical protein